MNRPRSLHAVEALAPAGSKDIGDANGVLPVERLGTTLRRLRTRRGLSLERLAHASGVSRSMLGQIEKGQSSPTVVVLWKIASALGVGFDALLPTTSRAVQVLPAKSAPLVGARPGCGRRTLHPDGDGRLSFEEVRIPWSEELTALAGGASTLLSATAASGEVDFLVAGRAYRLRSGDAVRYEGDETCVLRNAGRGEAVIFLASVPTGGR